MKTLEDEMIFIRKIMDMMAQHFSAHCEICLHDFSKGYDHSLVEIRNGHITGRNVGDCSNNVILDVVRGATQGGDKYNYITHSIDGKILRSSSLFIENDEGKVIGTLCVNQDITDLVRIEDYLKVLNHYDENQSFTKEVFASNVQQILEELIREATRVVGKLPQKMSKGDRMHFISYLDHKGAFLISKSGEQVCEYLNIAKGTLYNDLEAIRKTSDETKAANKQN